MADSDMRLEALEDELKLLKGEVKRTLVDLRAVVMREDSPLSERPTFGREPNKETVPQVGVEIRQVASEGVSTPSGDKVEALEQQLKAIKATIEVSANLPPESHQPVVNGSGGPMVWPGNNPAAQWPPGFPPPSGGSSSNLGPQPQDYPSGPQPDHPNGTLPSLGGPSTQWDGENGTNHVARQEEDLGERAGGPGVDWEANSTYTQQDGRARPYQPGKGRGSGAAYDSEQQDRGASHEGNRKSKQRPQPPQQQFEHNGWDSEDQDAVYPGVNGVSGGLSLSVNLVTHLTRWVFQAKKRVGQERLMDVLELYMHASPGSESLRELVVFISAIGEDEPTCNEPLGGYDAAELIHQLHGIVLGGGTGHQKFGAKADDGQRSAIIQRHFSNGG